MTPGLEARRGRALESDLVVIEGKLCGHCKLGEHEACRGTGLPLYRWICTCDSRVHLEATA